MATTTLTIKSNRLLYNAYLEATSALVPVDAAVAELFRLPLGFGDLWLREICVTVSALSGAYVAVAPPTEGTYVGILSSDATTTLDFVGAKTYSNVSTGSARPVLVASMELFDRTICRQDELFQVTTPIIAGAGVTASISLRVRGLRMKQA